METSKNTNPQTKILTKPSHHHLEEEKEDTLSLRDLPLNAENTNSSTTTEDHRSDSSSTELFEFLTSTSYDDLSPAENIIFAGKIIPLNYQNAFFSPPEHITPRIRSRTESLSAIHDHNKAPDDNAGLMRTSRSLNYCKLSTTVHSPPGNSSPVKKTVLSGSGKSVRPRWYVIMFGIVKFPPEIELKDIKNRQIRRNIPPVLFPSPSDRRSRRSRSRSPSSTWRFLNALSCKDPTSVATTAPFRLPHV